jgi:hypothetical protein
MLQPLLVRCKLHKVCSSWPLFMALSMQVLCLLVYLT